MESILVTDKLCKTFSNGGIQQHILKNLDIEIYNNDFTIIMGSSGAGKTTLLYSLSGMDKPTLGRINFLDNDISKFSNDKLALFRRKNCGFVFQQIFLLDNMNVLDNILLCGLLVNKNRKSVVRKAKELLEKVNLKENLWNKFPPQLSGGEKQRVAIVRALINSPKVVFADEPTGALNSSSGRAVLDVLSEVNNNNQSIIMVTHDILSALRGNRILFIRDGIINGECNLGKYNNENNKSRHEKLLNFLNEMGW
jgi:putative ABC transport system ATP-binding protein